MIPMSNIPAKNVDHRAEINIECTQEESMLRVAKCRYCENFNIMEDNTTKCNLSGCNISLMISFKFKTCPIGKW